MPSRDALDISLRDTVELAREVIPACEGAGITLAREQVPTTRAAAGALTARLDQLQYDLGEGPCLDAIRTGETVKGCSLPDERRWPRFLPQAAREGLVATLAVPLATWCG